MNSRAYSVLTIKSFDEELRVLRGLATHPSPDRENDCVVPEGIKVAAEIPLLLRHKSDQPVGRARLGRPTKDGTPFEATMAKIVEPGPLRDLCETAWQLVKYGLTRGCSIGFRVLESEPLPNGGRRFLKTEILELSLVEIPAHQNATITSVKDYDHAARGQSQPTARSAPATQQSKPAPVDAAPMTTERALTIGREFRAANIANDLSEMDRLICDRSFQAAATCLGGVIARSDFNRVWREKREGPNGTTGQPVLYTQDLHQTLIETLQLALQKCATLEMMMNANTDALRTAHIQRPFGYKGVFKSSETYTKGNFVTWSGALWACLGKTSEPPPGGNWQLAVAKGRDAR